jgi:glutamate-5-semialdehyde dehydrogenase
MSLTDSTPLAVAKAASNSSRALGVLPTQSRNDALTSIHQALSGAKDIILAANARDVELATKAAANGELSQSVLKRLDLSRKGKWEDMLQGILDVRNLEDPGESITVFDGPHESC